MAQTKNSDRRKKKYGDKRLAATARNKASKAARHKRREARFEARTLDLVGRVVRFGSKKDPQRGTVLEVVQRGDEGYPKGVRGRFLKISHPDGDKLVRRKAVRLANPT